MKIKSFYLATIILLSFFESAQAQTDPGPEAFDGLQSTLNEWMEDATETYESLIEMYDEYLRIGMLMSSDIRMSMNADFERSNAGVFPYILFWTSERKGSLDAKFDRQNMATSIRTETSESEKGVILPPIINDTTKQSGQVNTMYIDGAGFWYVPSEIQGEEVYIKVHLMQMMQNVAKGLDVAMEDAIAAKVTEMLDQLSELANLQSNVPDSEWLQAFIPQQVVEAFVNANENISDQALNELLEDLAELEFEQIGNIPPLIHFAFIISPTVARSRENVQESTVAWRGQENCTKMTIISGKDAGYEMVFDQYDRLIHLKDTDGSTADYRYDKDVTVNIPSAVSMGNLMKPNISTK